MSWFLALASNSSLLRKIFFLLSILVFNISFAQDTIKTDSIRVQSVDTVLSKKQNTDSIFSVNTKLIGHFFNLIEKGDTQKFEIAYIEGEVFQDRAKFGLSNKKRYYIINGNYDVKIKDSLKIFRNAIWVDLVSESKIICRYEATIKYESCT